MIHEAIKTKELCNQLDYGWKYLKGKQVVGNLSYLFQKYKPATVEDFLHEYLNDNTVVEDRQYRGRSKAELMEIAKQYQKYCNRYDLSLDTFFYNIIYHTIVQTFNGFKKEFDIIEYCKSKGYDAEFADPEDDIEFGIDVNLYLEGEKVALLQVKPISFFRGNSNYGLINDRVLAFTKRNKAVQNYGLPVFYVIYNKDEFVKNQKDGILHKLQDLLTEDGKTKGSI